MSENNIDKLFQNGLENSGAEPNEALWANIKANAGIQNPSIWIGMFNFYSIAFVAMCTLGVAGVVIYNTPSKSPATVTSEVPAPEKAATLAPEQNNTSNTTNPQTLNQNNSLPVDNNNTCNTNKVKYNPEITQINELSLTSGSSLSLANNMVYLNYKKGKYLLSVSADSIKLRIVAAPKNGKVLTDKATGNFNYQPNEGFYGVDSFMYVLVFPNGTSSNKATIKVNVAKQDKSKKNEPAPDTSSMAPIDNETPITKAENFSENTLKNLAVDIDVKKKSDSLML